MRTPVTTIHGPSSWRSPPRASFGASIYATGRASLDLPIAWAVLPPGCSASLLLTIPLVLLRRIRITSAAVPYVICGGLAEVGGFVSYALGARHGIAISAVFASQFAAISAVAAVVLFKERLGRLGIVGVIVIAAGVAASARCGPRRQSGYSSFRQARGSGDGAFGVRSSMRLQYGATNSSGATAVYVW